MRYLFFTSEHCKPCKIVKLEIIKHPEIYIIDIEKNQKIANKYGIMSIPTLLIIDKDGNVDSQITGTSIIKWLKDNNGLK
ncbi:MAG: thioredoxin family protein [Patescibacteria group bacterium]